MHSYGKALTITALLILLQQKCANAYAAEPCRDDGPTVTCTKQGFTVLMDGLSETERQLGLCRIDLKSCAIERTALQKHLDDLAAHPTECAPAPAPPQALAPALGYAAGIVGLLAATFAPTLPNTPDAWRMGVGLAGAALVGTGALLVIPR